MTTNTTGKSKYPDDVRELLENARVTHDDKSIEDLDELFTCVSQDLDGTLPDGYALLYNRSRAQRLWQEHRETLNHIWGALYERHGKPDLFAVLDGIVSSDYADQTLADVEEIERYAEACGAGITPDEAKRIQRVGLAWVHERTHGNGEWSRMRDDAKRAVRQSPEQED